MKKRVTVNQLIRQNPARMEAYKNRVAALKGWFEAPGHYGEQAQAARAIDSASAWINRVLREPDTVVSEVTVARLEDYVARRKNEEDAAAETAYLNALEENATPKE